MSASSQFAFVEWLPKVKNSITGGEIMTIDLKAQIRRVGEIADKAKQDGEKTAFLAGYMEGYVSRKLQEAEKAEEPRDD
jgi:hypothetical protein